MRNLNVKKLTLSSMMLALLIVSAFISIPMPHLKFTLQTLILFVISALLSPIYSFSTVLVYIVLGLIGLPVFSSGSGLAYVLNPSFGFILGFLAAAPAMSFIMRIEFSNKLIRYIIACLTGIIIIYLIGLPYLYYIVKVYMGVDITLKYAIITYGLMYLPFDVLKAAVAYPIASNKAIISLTAKQEA